MPMERGQLFQVIKLYKCSLSFAYKRSILSFKGVVQNFLSWHAFMPLSRLTYGAYLIHPLTILVFYQSKLSSRAYTDLDLVSEFPTICEVSCCQ